jgi:protein-tyrosine phosphatase
VVETSPGLYRHLLAAAADRLARAVALVVGGPRPTLVHCTAGKDRTGLVVAALLLAAGVQVEAVVADYVRTADFMADVIRRIEKHGRVPRNALWLLAPEAAIREVVATLGSSSGGAASWLITHGVDGGDLERWVEAFVGDTSDG